MPEQPEDPNEHVREYLRYFLALPKSPGFAVLIKGPWGVGKTYFLRRFLDEITDYRTRVAYVSLFGLKSATEIDDALFAAMHGKVAMGLANVTGRLASAAAKWAKIPIDEKIDFRSLMTRFAADIFVFDDLERCALSPREYLGYINQFVEHTGSKVIVVADDARLSSDPDYRGWIEKIIGQSLELSSSFDDAFSNFVQAVDDESLRVILESEKMNIREIYDRSEVRNLRMLRQALGFIDRFYDSVDDRHRSKQEAIASLTHLLLAFSFELRSGRLDSDDIVGRNSRYLVHRINKTDEEAPWIAKVGDRYPSVNMTNTAIPDDLLLDMLIKGRFDRQAIQSALDESTYYVSVVDEPPWRTVWHARERTDDQFDSALQRMEAQYSARVFEIAGEIMHVVGLRLWLCDVGELPLTRAQVVSDARNYIDELYAAGRLSALPRRDGIASSTRSYNSLGFNERETPDFREVEAHLRTRRDQVRASQRPGKAQELLGLMVTDPQEFYQRLTMWEHPQSLTGEPILATVAPAEFVDRLLALHPAQQRQVMMAFKPRFESPSERRELADEVEWLRSVRSSLLERARVARPIAKDKIESNVSWLLNGIFEEADDDEAPSVE